MDINSVLDYLKKNNNYVEQTLVDGFINEKTISYFPLYFLECFALNPEAQRKLLDLSENDMRIVSYIVSYAKEKNQDYIPLCALFSHFVEDSKFTNLIYDINKNGFDQSLTENLLFVITNGWNFFNINTIEDLRNLDSIRNEISNNNSHVNDPNLILLTKYGLSYEKTFNIYKRYGLDADLLPDSKEKDFLIDIRNIIEGKGTDKIVYDDKSFIINLDSILRNFYSKIYNEKFFKIDDSKSIGSYQGIQIYDAGVDFNMCVYSLGMATDYSVPDNYKSAWNRPSISTDYMCNSIISGCSMKTHIKHCVYGFNHFGPNELSLLGANDLGTGGIYKDINITNPWYREKLIADVEFRTPDNLLNNTRFTNNEVYRSRRRNVDGKLERINPDYIVYFKTDENYLNDQFWLESVNAAKDFGIPIVIVDCKKCLFHNIELLENKIETFESRLDDSNILSEIIEMIYSINSGFKTVAQNLLDNYFTNRISNYLNRIVKHLDEISLVAPKLAIECIDIILNTLDEEFNKVLKSPYWVDYAQKQGYKVDKPQDVITIFQKKRAEYVNISANGNNKQKNDTI